MSWATVCVADEGDSLLAAVESDGPVEADVELAGLAGAADVGESAVVPVTGDPGTAEVGAAEVL